MLFRFEEFFDSINYPYPGTTERTFQEKVQGKEGRQERTEKMNDEQLLKQHGELGSPGPASPEQQLAGPGHMDGKRPDTVFPVRMGTSEADRQRGGAAGGGRQDGGRDAFLV